MDFENKSIDKLVEDNKETKTRFYVCLKLPIKKEQERIVTFE